MSDRMALLERCVETLREIAEYDCEYGDCCPPNAGTRHGTCVGCRALAAVNALDAHASTPMRVGDRVSYGGARWGEIYAGTLESICDDEKSGQARVRHHVHRDGFSTHFWVPLSTLEKIDGSTP